MRMVPDWAIQASWWASGIFATGAVWYFLSLNDYPFAIVTAGGAVAFAILAIILHRRKDANSHGFDAAAPKMTPAEDFARRYANQPSHIRFIRSLPKLKAVVYENAHEGWDTGITADMRQASYDVIDFLEFAWLRLAEFYPPNHFCKTDPARYIRDYIRDRFAFHWSKHEPDGPGTGGTIVGALTGGDVIFDLERMIVDTVGTLFVHDDDFDYKEWLTQWQSKSEHAETRTQPEIDV